MGYLLDTNAVSAILKNETKVVTKMKSFTEKGEKLYISVECAGVQIFRFGNVEVAD